ncbi:MAG: nitrate- and nitrite sensing domain-containing protein [Natronospirillum sp.]
MDFSADIRVIATSGLLLVLASLFFLALHLRLQRQQRQRRQNTVQQLSLLRPLIADLQRHRGLSNGVLAGDETLCADLARVRQQVDHHIQQAVARYAAEHTGWQGLIDHWSRLREGKTIDPANNLTQHHLIIRNAIFLLEDVARDIELGEGDASLTHLRVVWRDVVQAAEWAGQARALGTGMVASGQSTASQRVRMRFLYQKMQQLADSAFAALLQLTSEHSAIFAQRLPSCQHAVDTLLQCIERELLANEHPRLSAKDYFQQATATIDELFALVDAALYHVQAKASQRRR